MAPSKKASRRNPKQHPPKPARSIKKPAKELVIVTGISGAGKASALKAFEDLGFHAVDNLPLELLPNFAALVRQSHEIERAVIVVDIRIVEERQLLDPIRNVADTLIDTSNFNVHELRANILERFGHDSQAKQLLVSCLSFGFKNGVPLDADMVFDIRFLPNPHFVPEFRKKTGLDPKVAAYICSFPQTREFLTRVLDLMLYLLPHYVAEGKSYLTVAFGCTGGQHRSVMMAEEIANQLKRAGYQVKALHRDMPR
jgi:UPF0042 nucleotide-binding protein